MLSQYWINEEFELIKLAPLMAYLLKELKVAYMTAMTLNFFMQAVTIQRVIIIFLNVYFSICFFSKKTINTYLKIEICVAFREFLAFKYEVILFFKKNS